MFHLFSRSKTLHIIALVIIIVLASIMRFSFAGINPYASDEAILSVIALDMAQGGDVARYGLINSAGTANLPASVYMFVPPYLLTSDPLIATLYVGLLNVLSIGVVWYIVQKNTTMRVGLLTGLLLATMPFAVFFSRNIWTQNLLVPLSAVWLLCAWIIIEKDNSRWRFMALIGLGFITGFGFQVHQAAISLIPMTLYVILRWRLLHKLHWIIIGGGVSALSLVPFLWHAYCCSPELVTAYLESETSTGHFSLQIIYDTIQLLLNYGWSYLAAGELSSIDTTIWTSATVLLLFVAGMIAIIRQVYRHKMLPSVVELALLFIVVPIVIFTYEFVEVRLHYALPALIGIVIIAGFSLHVSEKKWVHFSILGLAFVLVFAWNLQILTSLNLASQQVTPNGINTPLSVPRQVANSIPNDVLTVWHTQSEDVYLRGEPAIWRNLFYNRPHQIVSGWSTLLLPDEEAYLMMEIDDYHAWHELRYTGLMDERLQRLDPLDGAQPYYSQPYDGQTLPSQIQEFETPITFTTGLQAFGWYAWRDGDVLHISIAYRAISDPILDGTLQQFTHIRRADNQDAIQPDYITDISLGRNWREGDHLISLSIIIPIEEASMTYYVDIGQYYAEGGARILTDAGTDSVRVGPIYWE